MERRTCRRYGFMSPVTVHAPTVTGTVLDLGPGGFKVVVSGPVPWKPGDRVRFVIGRCPTLKGWATVRWVKGDRVGFTFEQLPPARYRELLAVIQRLIPTPKDWAAHACC